MPAGRSHASAFAILTGSGLTVSEDLARRFVAVDFDPRTEDPEARRFTADIRAEVTERRTELLAPMLTIWRRWGRIATDIEAGLPLGSFAQWCRWVREFSPTRPFNRSGSSIPTRKRAIVSMAQP